MTDLGERREFETAVYDPAEDSHLLASVCVEEISTVETVIDVGTGSGFVADRIREATDGRVVGVDINPNACRRAASHGIPVIHGDLVSAFSEGCADVVVCNPPYLPTAPEAVRSDWLSVALDGGPSGRAVVEALLADVSRVLTRTGRVYLLVSSLMDVPAVENTAASRGFVTRECARDASFPFEVLSVLRLDREGASA